MLIPDDVSLSLCRGLARGQHVLVRWLGYSRALDGDAGIRCVRAHGLVLLAPIAPYITEELWQRLGHPGQDHSIHTASWPIFDAGAIGAETLILPVQVNGRVRGRIEVASDTPEAEIKRQALQVPQVQSFLAAQKVTRMIYVPERLVNIVTA